VTRAVRVRAFVAASAVALLGTGTALAAFPADPPNDPAYDPAEQGGPATCATTSADNEQHYLYSFIPRCAINATDPEGAAGMSVDTAWRRYTTGSPDTVIAYIEGGINWQDEPEELANKVFLNRGELPRPTTPKRDGALNARDYADTPDRNGNGLVDPEDIIVRFSDRSDDDDNGYVDDISGWDFYNDQNDPTTIDSKYDHANGQMRQAAAETNNGIGEAGVCPRCMVLPIKAGAEALDRTDDLAEAWNYAADMNVDVLVSVTADLGYSTFMRQTVERLWDRGVVMVEASNDFDSTDHQGGQFWPHVLPGNGLVANAHGVGTAPGAAAVENPLITSFRARSGFTSWGTHNIFSAATQGGTTSEATPTVGGVMALVLDWGKRAAKRGLIERSLTNSEAIQVVRDTTSDISGPTNWPSRPGFDLQFGYGRPNVAKAMAAISRGDVPPVAWFDSPRWYSLYDPMRTRSVPIAGHVDAPRTRGAFRWKLEFAPGAEPDEDAFETVSAGRSREALDGRLGELDLSRVPKSFWSAAFTLSKRKELETSEKYTVTLRIRVRDAKGRMGEERRTIAVHHDPALRKGFPKRIGPSGEAQPQLADLQGKGRLAMVFGDADGYVHAIDGRSGRELEGWPVHSLPTKVERGHRGVDPGYEPFINNVAVGPLSPRGRLSVVATSSTGRVYVWNRFGHLRRGWPRTLAKGVRKPEVPRPRLPFTRLPIRGASAPPVLADLNQNGRLDIVQVGWDGRVHAFRENGGELEGYPFKVELPAGNQPAGGRIRVDDQKLDTPPAIADLDGDGSPEIVLRSQYTDALGSGLQPLPVSHLHAYHADGSVVDGWPINVQGLVSFVGSAQEFITEGAAAPVAADIDGDGDDEVAFAPALFSPTSIFDGNGQQIRTLAPVSGPTLSLLAGNQQQLLDALQGNLPADTPVNFTTSGAFGRIGSSERVGYTEPGSGAASVAGALLLTGSGQPINSYVRAFDAGTGALLPGFPAKLQGLDFLGAPAIADVTGDGNAEVINGADSSAIGAYGEGGAQVGGFPHFQSGWMLWGPSIGDLTSSGRNDVVATTREGYLFAWRTKGRAGAGNDEWWAYRHDERNTATFGTDTRPPGAVRKPRVKRRDGRIRLSFRVPGDDWYAGRATVLGVRYIDIEGRRIPTTKRKRRVKVDVAGGERMSLTLLPRTKRVVIRVRDEARNGSPRFAFRMRGVVPTREALSREASGTSTGAARQAQPGRAQKERLVVPQE